MIASAVDHENRSGSTGAAWRLDRSPHRNWRPSPARRPTTAGAGEECLGASRRELYRQRAKNAGLGLGMAPGQRSRGSPGLSGGLHVPHAVGETVSVTAPRAGVRRQSLRRPWSSRCRSYHVAIAHEACGDLAHAAAAFGLRPLRFGSNRGRAAPAIGGPPAPLAGSEISLPDRLLGDAELTGELATASTAAISTRKECVLPPALFSPAGPVPRRTGASAGRFHKPDRCGCSGDELLRELAQAGQLPQLCGRRPGKRARRGYASPGRILAHPFICASSTREQFHRRQWRSAMWRWG
jgi:hypothetical protein